MMFKFLSSISHHRVFGNRSKLKLFSLVLGITFTLCINNRLFHLMTILLSVSDSTWVIALCWLLLIEAFSLY